MRIFIIINIIKTNMEFNNLKIYLDDQKNFFPFEFLKNIIRWRQFNRDFFFIDEVIHEPNNNNK